jgi:hypothetical protein
MSFVLLFNREIIVDGANAQAYMIKYLRFLELDLVVQRSQTGVPRNTWGPGRGVKGTANFLI